MWWRSGACVLAMVVVGGCSTGPLLEEPDEVCPLFSAAREARGGDDRAEIEDAVTRLLDVMPEEYHDELALWYFPVGGPVGGLDTSGNAAMEAGDLLNDLYTANC